MFKIDHDEDASDLASDPASPQELLVAENVGLRLLLTQAKLSAETLLAQAGIDAKEREASDKLQKLILEEPAPSHQEHAGDGERDCVAKSAQCAEHASMRKP